jgi:hypothetical protein
MDIKKPKKIKGGFFIEPRIPLMRPLALESNLT